MQSDCCHPLLDERTIINGDIFPTYESWYQLSVRVAVPTDHAECAAVKIFYDAQVPNVKVMTKIGKAV